MLTDRRTDRIVKLSSHNTYSIYVCRVAQYDYLGLTVAEYLSWHANTDRLASKVMKRPFHLRKLREFHVNPQLIALFYHSIIESVALLVLLCGGCGLTKGDKKRSATSGM